jgi:hypothetical protein
MSFNQNMIQMNTVTPYGQFSPELARKRHGSKTVAKNNGNH